MKSWRYLKYGFSIVLIILSTWTFGQTDSLHLKRLSERKLTKNIVSQYCQFQTISLKINAKVTSPKKSYNLNITYRNAKDSIIWININHNSGIPVARFLITPDSIKMLNRIDKKFLSLSNCQIVKKFGYDISFDMIQSIFSAQLINLDSEKTIMQVYKHYKVYQDSNRYVLQNIKRNKLNRLHKKEKINDYLIHKTQIDNNFKILSILIQDYVNNREIKITYPEYQKNSECMKEIDISLKKSEEKMLMKLKIKKIKLNKSKLNFSFKIPEKYELKTL